MTTTTQAAPAAHRAAVDLAAIREQWGDLLAAIEQAPAAEWPPRDARDFDRPAPAAVDDDEHQAAAVGRMPLVLREHPAPLNLDALDAALAVEEALFDTADAIAEVVQRSIRTVPVPTYGNPGATMPDPGDAADPARWHYQAPTSPGSRAYGLHWAAVWLEGRALDEPSGDLFAPVPARTLDDLARVASLARRRVERALGRDGRTTTLDRPCPWCGDALTGRTQPGGEPSVSCMRGEACTAPVLLDRGRRIWRGAELVGLWAALDAAGRREQPAA
ncbi:hypothetical protein ACFYWN_12075 [Streptomyces sp. NPDC002917]|uniref:hypothetical protein n=1 Tax=Streptomyces sp. NPDC002917 TaxID=3364671 RepID=UPI0036BFF0F5